MTPQRYEQIRRIFLEVHGSPPAQRRAALDRLCAADADLRAEVEALLAGEQRTPFLDAPALGSAFELNRLTDTLPTPLDQAAPTSNETTRAASDAGHAPAQIGPYRLLERLGEGGFGTVYLAQQEQPVARRVALKIIKPGMDSRDVIARFEAERQALAMMDHPNIARVLDVGATETGRPYFVMELVRGVPVTDYCDQKKLDICRRLELFRTICQAVQHAHTKGIIHRDIKPSNVLVAEDADQPIPKIIDFGIAKALHQRLTDLTLHTQAGQFIGTPTYMSPEQAAGGGGLDIDTRSDIYSLGVLLYELLTGSTPFESTRLKQAALDQILKIIREEEPPRPSHRLSRLDQVLTAPSPLSEPGVEATGAGASVRAASQRPRGSDSAAELAARQRRTDSRRLRRTIRGELDWIVMKCLEKDRARRYETANGVANDIQRYLSNEPVVAGPPSRMYRLRKLVRRNRGSVIAAGLVAASLLAAVIGTTTGLLRARYERDEKQAQSERADRAARRSARVAELLKEILAGAGPFVAAGKDATLLREILETAAERLPSQLRDDPEVEAEMRSVIGRAFRDIGESEKAVAQLQGAIALWRRLGESAQLALANDLDVLGTAFLNDRAVVQAESVLFEALEIRRNREGADAPALVSTVGGLGVCAFMRGNFSKAEELLLQALAIQRSARERGAEVDGPEDTLNSLAFIYSQNGRLAEAIKLYEEALAGWRLRMPPVHPSIATALSNLGVALYQSHRGSEAVERLTEALQMHRQLLGPDHVDVAYDISKLASAYEELGDYQGAESHYHEALRLLLAKRGPEHVDVAWCHNNLGLMLLKKGDFADAAESLQSALNVMRAAGAGEHPNAAQAMVNLSAALLELGRSDQAEQYSRESLAILNAKLPADHPRRLTAERQLATAIYTRVEHESGSADLMAEARLREAESLLTDADDRLHAQATVDPLIRQRIASEIARAFAELYELWNRLFPATELAERAASWRAKLAEWQAFTQPASSPASAP